MYKALINQKAGMGSTLCVRCGAILIPGSYCEVCDNVLCFKCSSCSMITDERIHAFCQNADIVNTRTDRNQDLQELLLEPNSVQTITNSGYLNNYCNLQNQLNDEIKHNSIRLTSSFWFNTFESIKLINRYWNKIFNIGNSGTNFRIS
jgi:hypothetical protein